MQKNKQMISHLSRRAGFGSTPYEIDELSKLEYENIVEKYLNIENVPQVDILELYRYHPMTERPVLIGQSQFWWLYHMVNTKRPLEEKIALFWHQVFATGESKVESPFDLVKQIQLFKKHGLGNFKTLLIEISKNPAMLFWLDNNENHKRAPNENWGRELLELFSMGATNYTEKDVFEASRAFSGWTMYDRLPQQPWGPYLWDFKFDPDDHDYSKKTFLGHTAKLNGEDIIEIILQQPATANFIARHIYNFFVADEPQVPAWPIEPPNDKYAIKKIQENLIKYNWEIKPTLRELFNSEYFKGSLFKKVKNPAEVVAGTLKLTKNLNGPHPGWVEMQNIPGFMGQNLFDPPSVEGWHTGKEWINSGAFMTRVNFISDQITNVKLQGVKNIFDHIIKNLNNPSPQEVVTQCLETLGGVQVEQKTFDELVHHTESISPVICSNKPQMEIHISSILSLIVGTREYQFC